MKPRKAPKGLKPEPVETWGRYSIEIIHWPKGKLRSAGVGISGKVTEAWPSRDLYQALARLDGEVCYRSRDLVPTRRGALKRLRDMMKRRQRQLPGKIAKLELERAALRNALGE